MKGRLRAYALSVAGAVVLAAVIAGAVFLATPKATIAEPLIPFLTAEGTFPKQLELTLPNGEVIAFARYLAVDHRPCGVNFLPAGFPTCVYWAFGGYTSLDGRFRLDPLLEAFPNAADAAVTAAGQTPYEAYPNKDASSWSTGTVVGHFVIGVHVEANNPPEEGGERLARAAETWLLAQVKRLAYPA